MKLAALLLCVAPLLPAAPLRLLVVTGGHSYSTAFYTLFEGYPDIVWDHAVNQQEAYKPGNLDLYDVLVLHDMAKTLPDDQKERLKAFVEKGKGVVLLHHALCSYDSWPWWWQEATGGHYFIDAIPGHPASTYQHDEEMLARPVKGREDHPILRGIGPLQLNDETYHGMWLSPKATVLMEIEHPRNDRPLVYIGPNPAYRVVTIQLGHSEGTLRDPGYRKLVHNAILWSAAK